MTCPNNTLLVAFQQQELVEEKKEEITIHLQTCPVCHYKLQNIKQRVFRTVSSPNRIYDEEGQPLSDLKVDYTEET